MRRKELSPGRRKRVKKRASQLIAKEMSLRESRRASHKLTHERIAQTSGIGKDQVSRLEQRTGLLISTLRDYVEAMGGRLKAASRWLQNLLTTNPRRYLVLRA
jgi:hypothetical protein